MESIPDFGAFARKIGFDPLYLEAFEAKLFFSGPRAARKLTNFFVLLLLATVIATYGVLSDSTATVIGAMIVAPLMGPIMATAAAVVIGSFDRAWKSLILVAIGVICVILLSWLLAMLVPDVTISFTENGEISSRIAPGLMALLTALASGAAGAYITSREEIADSMGGVAIAISLVPPLCVVGISLSQGAWDPAWGAMTLFLTNFLAILLAGGITFMIGGLGRLAITDSNQRMRRNAFILIVAGTLLIAVPLTVTTAQALDHALENRSAMQDVNQWLAGTMNSLVQVDVRGAKVLTTVEGAGELRPLQELANQLSTTLERPIVVVLRTIPSQVEASGTTSQ